MGLRSTIGSLPLLPLALFLEYASIKAVADWIGWAPTITLTAIGVGLGVILIGREFGRLWRILGDAWRARRFPDADVLGAAPRLFAGALLCIPGPATQVTGLLLLIPVVRGVVAVAAICLLAVGSVVLVELLGDDDAPKEDE